MDKIAYITCINFHQIREDIGVEKKVMAQYEIFQKEFDTYLIAEQGLDIVVLHNNEKKVISHLDDKRRMRIKLCQYANDFIEENMIKNIYIRYFFAVYPFIKMLKKMKKNNAKVIIEIPTYPYDNEPRLSLKSKYFYLVDKLKRNTIKKYVDRIATFSTDEEIFGIKCINIKNGIIINNVIPRCPKELNNVINLIAVSIMCNWHGYDRFIEGLHQYYCNGGKREISLHLVGDGIEMPKYIELVEKYKLNDKIFFYGLLSGNKLDKIYNKCDLAIECLGLHRKGVYLSSSLKSREYGAKGLPIITSCKIDIFPANYRFILSVPADESNININSVIEFYDNIYNKNNKQIVSTEIREFTKKNCDMSITMNPIIKFFKQ